MYASLKLYLKVKIYQCKLQKKFSRIVGDILGEVSKTVEHIYLPSQGKRPLLRAMLPASVCMCLCGLNKQEYRTSKLRDLRIVFTFQQLLVQESPKNLYNNLDINLNPSISGTVCVDLRVRSYNMKVSLEDNFGNVRLHVLLDNFLSLVFIQSVLHHLFLLLRIMLTHLKFHSFRNTSMITTYPTVLFIIYVSCKLLLCGCSPVCFSHQIAIYFRLL